MQGRFPDRSTSERLVLLVCAAAALTVHGQTPAPPAPAIVLDRVVAVVNNQAILWSDIVNEIRFSVLDPEVSLSETLTPQRAVQELISRALIQQQIRQEDATAAQASGEEVQARVEEVRRDLPVCVRMHCATDAGWQNFLAANGLTAQQVETYLALRLEILRFIEIRFRQGIRIPQQDIESYYRNKLVPMYAKGATVPPLTEVSARIEEILLEQQVNTLFDAWLDNLRQQGDVEILDPSLESGKPPSGVKDAAQ